MLRAGALCLLCLVEVDMLIRPPESRLATALSYFATLKVFAVASIDLSE